MNRLVIAIMACPAIAAAEVSDKIPIQASIWAVGIVGAVLLLIGARWSKWLNLLAVPILVYLLVLAYETSFGDISSSIRSEQGIQYSVSVYGSIFLVFASLLLANYLRKKN